MLGKWRMLPQRQTPVVCDVHAIASKNLNSVASIATKTMDAKYRNIVDHLLHLSQSSYLHEGVLDMLIAAKRNA